MVLPSLPGYGFSGPALRPGWGTRRIAAAWAELMARLGYDRYGAIGNDAGSMISPELGRQQPAHVAGVHVTQLFSFPSGDPAELDGLDADEQRAVSVLQWFWQEKGAFNVLQGQQPQTLAHALADSPAGLLGWNAPLLDETLDDDFVLANVTLYWLTGTAGTSIRHYYEDTHQPAEAPAYPTQVPVGLPAAADGDFRSIRRFAARDHANITSRRRVPSWSRCARSAPTRRRSRPARPTGRRRNCCATSAATPSGAKPGDFRSSPDMVRAWK